MANTSSNGKKVVKQTAVKQTAVKQTAVKQTAVKQTAVKQTAVKQSAVKANTTTKINSTGSKSNTGKFILEYSITAIAQKEEDYSGATIMEWFDSGRKVDAIACPYDYNKKKNLFEVIWQGEYNDFLKKDIIDEAIDQIKYWSTQYDAYFIPNSYIFLKDSTGKIVKKFNFENESWES